MYLLPLSEFGVEYSLTRKTVCLKCNLTVPVACLNGQKLMWEANVKHVGNIITSTIADKDDIELNIQEYFCQINKLLSDFQGLRHDALSELFNKYCNSFYWSQAWDLRSTHVLGLYRAWKRGVRRSLDLSDVSHRFLLPLLLKNSQFRSTADEKNC